MTEPARPLDHHVVIGAAVVPVSLWLFGLTWLLWAHVQTPEDAHDRLRRRRGGGGAAADRRLEQEMLAKGVDMDDDRLVRPRASDLDADRGEDGRRAQAAEQKRAFGEARDRYEVREKLWASFQEAQRYMRRSKMSERANPRP